MDGVVQTSAEVRAATRHAAVGRAFMQRMRRIRPVRAGPRTEVPARRTSCAQPKSPIKSRVQDLNLRIGG